MPDLGFPQAVAVVSFWEKPPQNDMFRWKTGTPVVQNITTSNGCSAVTLC